MKSASSAARLAARESPCDQRDTTPTAFLSLGIGARTTKTNRDGHFLEIAIRVDVGMTSDTGLRYTSIQA